MSASGLFWGTRITVNYREFSGIGPQADSLKFMANLWIICDNSRSKTNRCDAKRLHLLSFFDNGDDLRWGHDCRCDGEMFEVACHKK